MQRFLKLRSGKLPPIASKTESDSRKNAKCSKSQWSVERVFLTSCLIFMLVISPFVLSAARVSAASAPPVYYVASSGSDSTGTGSIGSPYATISHAVAQAAAYYASSKNASAVIVGPGTYHEMVVITTPLTLVSQSSQSSNTVIDATGQVVGIAIIGPKSAGTVVEGFTVQNANNEGIYVQDSSNVMIENNVATHNALSVLAGLGEVKGIQLTGTSDSTVAGNSAVGNMYGGIGVTDDGPINPSMNSTAVPSAGIPAGSASPGNNNVISGNLVAANRPNHCAIVISAYNQGEGVSNDIISSNVVVDNQNGVIVAADTPNTIAVNDTVINNNILNNGEGGVVIHSNAPGDVVTGNAIIGNLISANGYLPTLEGIIVGGEGPVAVQHTTISGNTFQNEAIGIQIVNGENTLVGGNEMEATVKLPVNGTVTALTTATVTSASGQDGTTTVSQTVTATTTATQTVTSTATTSGGASTTSEGGLTFSLALLVAIGTLIVGLIAGMIVRPIREASGR